MLVAHHSILALLHTEDPKGVLLPRQRVFPALVAVPQNLPSQHSDGLRHLLGFSNSDTLGRSDWRAGTSRLDSRINYRCNYHLSPSGLG